MKYKTETHLHVEESCHCSDIPTEQMMRQYQKDGFKTIIITPHYARHYFTVMSNDWDVRIDYLLFGYKIGKKLAASLGMNVLLGLELTLIENGSDYLIYGMDEDFLRSNYNLYDLTLDQLIELCKKNNYLLVQAHPFRKGMHRADLKHQMPLEVFNGRHVLDSNNEEARKYAEEHGLIALSGTDFHDLEDHRGGIVTDEEIISIEDFKRVVLERNYTLI